MYKGFSQAQALIRYQALCLSRAVCLFVCARVCIMYKGFSQAQALIRYQELCVLHALFVRLRACARVHCV